MKISHRVHRANRGEHSCKLRRVHLNDLRRNFCPKMSSSLTSAGHSDQWWAPLIAEISPYKERVKLYPNLGAKRPFYSWMLCCLTFEWKWGTCWPCFDVNLMAFLTNPTNKHDNSIINIRKAGRFLKYCFICLVTVFTFCFYLCNYFVFVRHGIAKD